MIPENLRGRLLSQAELGGVASSVAAHSHLWESLVRHEPDQRVFEELLTDEHLSVWLICWMEGHDTGFHDHDGAAGAVSVVQGSICESRLRFAGPPRSTVHHAREVLTFGPDDIHRVTHVAGEPAITIHAYSPELRRMGAYVEGPDGILMRRAQDEEEELVSLSPVAAVA